MSSAWPGWVRHVPPLHHKLGGLERICATDSFQRPPFLPSFCPLSLHCPSSQCFSLFLLHHNSKIKASRGLWVLVPDYSSTSFGAVRRSHPPGLCPSMRFLISSPGTPSALEMAGRGAVPASSSKTTNLEEKSSLPKGNKPALLISQMFCRDAAQLP